MSASIFSLHVHGFSLVLYIQHLFFDGLATLGAYKARTMCSHTWHRVLVTILITLLVTTALVSLIG